MNARMCARPEYLHGPGKMSYTASPAVSPGFRALSPNTSLSSAAVLFPSSVITTPAMLTSTATTLATDRVSSPMVTPNRRVNSADVEDRMVVLATLVMDKDALDRYCRDEGGEVGKE